MMSREQRRQQIQRKRQTCMSHKVTVCDGIKLANCTSRYTEMVIQRASYGFHFLSESGNWQAWRYNSGNMCGLIKLTKPRLLRDIQACQRHLTHWWISSHLKLQPAAVSMTDVIRKTQETATYTAAHKQANLLTSFWINPHTSARLLADC